MKTLVKRLERRLAVQIAGAVRGRLASAKLSWEIRNRLPNESFATIFDVGANVGQSVSKFLVDFPKATIFAFEPDPQTFQELTARFPPRPAVCTFNLALGSAQGMKRFDNRAKRSMRRIAKDQSESDLPTVEVSTIDAFCSEAGIHSIDYLKVDTEGHDLEVLRGGEHMLRSGVINLFVAECSPNRDNTHHVQFAELHQYAEDHGYRLFGLYEQHPEWPTRKPHLRRLNAAYISPAVIARN